MGWAYAPKVGARARLHQAADSEEQLVRYLADNVLPNLFSRCGRTLQVDGSFGMTAAIGEMLLQSDRGVLEILPALPPTWNTGAVSGKRARLSLTRLRRCRRLSLARASADRRVVKVTSHVQRT